MLARNMFDDLPLQFEINLVEEISDLFPGRDGNKLEIPIEVIP